MRQFSASQQFNFLLTSLIVLNQTFLFSCAEWCSWSALQCKSETNNKCWNYRMRSCNCPAAIGLADTCSGPAEEITKITCQTQCGIWSPILSNSPWCEWNLWSTWTSLDLCTYNENIEQRVRKRQCNCATKFSNSFCFPTYYGSIYDYSNRSVISDECSALNWCDWSEWDDCKGTCPTKTQTRSRTCGCLLDKGSYFKCPGGYSKSTENRNCSISSCDDGNTFSWIFSHGTLIGGFFIVAAISIIIFVIRIIYYKRFQRRLNQRRVFGVQSDGVTVTSTSTVIGSADMFGNSVNPWPLTENASYPRQLIAVPQNINAEYINEGFYPFLTPPPPPYCPPTDNLASINEFQPPSYDECCKVTNLVPTAPSENPNRSATNNEMP